MASIESSSYPLGFRVADASLVAAPPDKAPISIRTVARALEGMQKEALVRDGPDGTVWRLVCDEGPYLNGTDLAPFPLAFFTAGLAATYFGEIEALAAQRGIALSRLEVVQDNKYTMEGSAVKGTMTGGALPVELDVRIDAADGTDAQALRQLVGDAVAASPGDGLLRAVLTSLFSLTCNGASLGLERVAAAGGKAASLDEAVFDGAVPADGADVAQPMIEKLSSAETVFGVAGGAGSSLQADQKRMLHVRGICTKRADGVKSVKIQLFKPIGSVFTILADDPKHLGGRDRAPSGLALMSAGLAFCYMTQLGRYAHIVKQPLGGYRIVQDTYFSLPGASGKTGQAGTAEAVETHVHIETEAGEGFPQTLVDMGEQTCFLHALCRTPLKTRIRVGSEGLEAA